MAQGANGPRESPTTNRVIFEAVAETLKRWDAKTLKRTQSLITSYQSLITSHWQQEVKT